MDARRRKDNLKEIIRQIHDGADLESMKRKFKETMNDVDPTEIGMAEQELVQEGMPQEEIRRLCDVHLAVMQDALGNQEREAPPGHPIHTFKEEHRLILQFLSTLEDGAAELTGRPERAIIADRLPALRQAANHLLEAEGHHVREENVLFPYMGKHGITEPPAVMWSEHNDLRALKKRVKEVIDSHDRLTPEEFAEQLGHAVKALAPVLSSHIYKENNILYPMALDAISPHEWPEIRRECDELGYCCFSPASARSEVPEERPAEAAHVCDAGAEPAQRGMLKFPTGSLTREQVEWVLNTLPVDITFVDADDTFRYFSGTQDRAFARSRASLGRKVQQCHPAKSLPLVNAVLEDLKSGRKNSEHFWIHLGDKFLYISYFAVRNDRGEYLGTLETIQDIAPLQGIQGEKRLR
ncbi:MAG: DUF438 domain-containing protein [Ignavibacteriales bacterium]